MGERVNRYGQPIGFAVPDWQGRARPPRSAMESARCRVEPLEPGRHAQDLFEAYAAWPDARHWTYLPYGPFPDAGDFRRWLTEMGAGEDPMFHAIVERVSGRALGLAAFLRIAPAVGVIEVGHISYSARLQDTVLATEAMFLMMRRVFDELGYRRYEWKCDALNAPSRRAALRLGFRFEGIFRQATLYRGRNRDTAWYAIIDREWPALRGAFERWLAPANFDADGRQRARLGALIEAARGSAGC